MTHTHSIEGSVSSTRISCLRQIPATPLLWTSMIILALAAATPTAAGAQCEGDGTSITPCPPANAHVMVGLSYSVSFTVTNSNSSWRSYDVQVTCGGSVSACSPRLNPLWVDASSSAEVVIDYTVGASAASGTVTLKAVPEGSADGPFSTLVVEAKQFVNDLSMTNSRYRDPAVCEVACFAATYSHSSIPFFTLNTPRSVTIAYNSDAHFARPFVLVDVVHLDQPTIDEWWLDVTVNGSNASFTNGDVGRIRFGAANGPRRLAGQIDATGLPTGAYPMAVTITAWYNGMQSSFTETVNTDLVVVNYANDPVAAGWGIAGLQKLHFPSSGYLATDGSGAFTRFTSLGAQADDFTTLAADGSNYVRSYPDGSKVTFNSSGQMVAAADFLGRATTFGYDGSGRLTSVLDPMRNAGRTVPYITLGYGSYGLSEIRQTGFANDRVTSVGVNASRQLTAVTDPDGYGSQLSYDGYGRLGTVTDRRGAQGAFGYETKGWKVNSRTTYGLEIDAGGGSSTLTNVTNWFGAWQITGAPSGPTSTSPASAVLVSSVEGTYQDHQGRTTRFAPNRYGQSMKTTDPAGRATTIYRNRFLPTTVLHPDGSRRSYDYDTEGRVTWSASPRDTTVYYRYGTNSQIDSVWGLGIRPERRILNGDGSVQRIRYDGNAATEVAFTYDATTKRAATFTDSAGYSTSYAYDARFGNASETAAPGNAVTAIALDAYGRDSAVTAPGVATRRVIYDVLNRASEEYDGVNATPTRFAYDGFLVSRIADANGNVNKMAYNKAGWLVRRNSPADTTVFTSYRHDVRGLLTSMTNRRGERVDWLYDAAGRLVRKSGTNVATDTIWHVSNNTTAVAWNSSARDSTVREERRPSSVSVVTLGGQAFTIARRIYDLNHTPDTVYITSTSGVSFPNRVYHKDATRAFTSAIEISGFGTLSLNYNTDGSRRSTGWPNSGSRAEGYTSHATIPEASFTDGTLNSVFRRAYRYDTGERLIAAQRYGGQGTVKDHYGYDQLGRLERREVIDQSCNNWPGSVADSNSVHYGWRYTCASPASSLTYSYDPLGNRTDNGGSYTAGNRISSFAGVSFSHDADGNVTSKSGSPSRTFTWDAQNRLTSVTASGATVGFEYDAAGRLVRRTRNGSSERWYLWDGDELLAELDASLQRLSEYVYYPGIDQPLAVITGATSPTAIQYPIQDEVGNVIGTAQGSSAAQTVSYDPWGTPSISGSGSNRLLWKGLLWEPGEVELYYMRNRWYDPTTGRFISEDPIGVSGGLNLYAFGAPDPVNTADPYGKCPWCIAGGVSVGVGYAMARLTGAEYGWEQAAGDFVLGATGAYAVKYLAAIRAFGPFAHYTPTASNPALQRAIDVTFQRTDRIPGGTIGALMNEARTGISTQGRFHIKKAHNTLNRLRNIRGGGGLGSRDRRTLDRMIRAFEDAIDFYDQAMQ